MRPIRNLLAALLLMTASGTQAITLDYCLERAETNYPLVCQYGIIAKTGDISLSDINRGWLPRIGIYAQATAQNSVPGFPETLSNIISQMGQEIEGLGHVQYKAGVDLSQTIWDGGSSKAQRSIAQAETDRSRASVRTEIYAVRQKVTDIFFGILLMEEQIGQTENTLGLLKANLSLMQAMQKNGTAMASDVDMVEAQYLSMTQKLTEAKTALESYRRLLSIILVKISEKHRSNDPMPKYLPIWNRQGLNSNISKQVKILTWLEKMLSTAPYCLKLDFSLKPTTDIPAITISRV